MLYQSFFEPQNSNIQIAITFELFNILTNSKVLCYQFFILLHLDMKSKHFAVVNILTGHTLHKNTYTRSITPLTIENGWLS